MTILLKEKYRIHIGENGNILRSSSTVEESLVQAKEVDRPLHERRAVVGTQRGRIN